MAMLEARVPTISFFDKLGVRRLGFRGPMMEGHDE
ncbi:MAG: hypothetical protein ACI8S3_001851 [Alphaproteobacteria bacterium]|jgi:hypothetical protein